MLNSYTKTHATTPVSKSSISASQSPYINTVIPVRLSPANRIIKNSTPQKRNALATAIAPASHRSTSASTPASRLTYTKKANLNAHRHVLINTVYIPMRMGKFHALDATMKKNLS